MLLFSLSRWLPPDSRWFSRSNVQSHPNKRRPWYIPQLDRLEDRCVPSFVPLLPAAGTMQQDARGLNAVLYTPEGDDAFNQANLPAAKLVTVMNNSSNLMFPIFYGANSTADPTAGQVVRLELLTPGSGYGSGPVTVTISGGSGTTIATGKVQANGSLFGLELVSGGAGYLPGDQLTVTFGGTGTGATAKAYVSQHDATFALYDPKDPLNKTYRGYVGEIDQITGNYNLGLQPGHQVTVMVPMAFWDGGRFYLATNGSVPLTSEFDPGFPLQANSEWLYNPTLTPITTPVLLGAGESFIVAPAHAGDKPLYGANFPDPVTGYANQSGVVMWYRDLSAPHDFGFGVPAVLTEMSIRDPKQPFIAPDMPPSEVDTIINYDVSYVDSLALPASMEGSFSPTRPLATPGPQQFTWLGSDMSSEQMQQLIAAFTTNDVTGGTAGVGGVNGLGQYFGGLGYDQYFMPPDNSPSGAITAINNPPSGPVTIFTASTGAMVNGMTVAISNVMGQTSLNANWVVSSVTPTSFVLTGAAGSMTPASGGSFAAQTTGVHVQKLPAGFEVIADSQNQNVASSFDASRYNLVSGGTKANISTVGTGVSVAGSKNITGVSYATAVKMVAGMIWSPDNAANGKPYFPNGARIESITLGTVGGTDSIITMTQKANESGSPGGSGGGTGPGGSWTFNGSQYTSTLGSIAASANQITNLDPKVGIYLRPGMLVTGSQIPPGTYIAANGISADFKTITLTQNIGATPSAGPYTFLGGPDSYVVQKLINVWYAWADYYVKQLASGPNAAPSGSFAGTTTANGGRTDYNSLILKVTNAAFDMTQLRVGDVVTGSATLTTNTSGDPSLNYTIVSIDEVARSVELSLPVAVTGAVADTFNFSPPQHIVRSSDAPMATGTAGTIPYTLDFAGATQAEKDNALNYARTVYKVMQSFSLLLDPQTLLSRSALLLRYSIGGNVGSFTTNDGFFPQTGRHTTLPHLRTHVQLRDEIKSILRGVYDFQKVPDQSLWYPDPAVQTPNATLDQGSGAQAVNFGIYNISPYVWFVHVVLHNSSYGFSLDDDVANTTANSNSIQIAFGGNAYTAPTDTNDPPAPNLKNPEAYTGGAQYGTQQSQGFIDVTSSHAVDDAKKGMTTISGLSQVAVARLKASTDPSDPPGALITSDTLGLLPPGVRIALVTALPPVGGQDNQSYVTFLTPQGWTAPTNQTQHQFTFSGFSTAVPSDVAPSVSQAPPGTVITITGKGLTGVFGVSFNGIPGAIVTAAISSISNPNLGTITINTANTQGLVNGDHVTISGVTGQTAINGTWVVSNVVANTSFQLTGITGNGVASGGGTWIAGTDSAVKVIVPSFIPNQNGTTHPGPTGKIGVRNASGTDYSSTFFTIGSAAAPTFSGIGQPGGTTANGSLNSTVKLFGAGFTGTTAVTYNGTPISKFTVNGTGTEVQITIPVGASGTNQPFTLTVNGTPYTSTGFTFTVNQPVIAASNPFSPSSGPVGTTVTITGTGFTGADNPTTGGVTIGGTAATNVQVINDTTITARVGPGTPTGSGQVVVTTSAGSGNSGTNTFDVTAHQTPTITSASSTTAPVGAQIQLQGTNFTGASGITFGGVAATTFTVVDDQNINVTVPVGAPLGSAPIVVTNPGGSSSPFAFTVTAATQPVITQFTPGFGDENDEVTLTGSGFTGVHQVEFFDRQSAFFTVVNDNTLITRVPSGAKTGPISVTNGLGTGTSTTNFVVGAQPTITSFSPDHGPAGTVVTLTGAGFNKVVSVSFNGTVASSFQVISDASLTATVPVGATTGRITVFTSDGHASSDTDFTVTIVPADHFETSTWVDYSTNTGWSPQYVGDFNGDGKDDVANFLASNGGWYISLSTGTSFMQPLRWVDLADSSFAQHLVGDFNGDGKDDIASFYSPNGVWYVGISDGTKFTSTGWVDLANTGWITQQAGDFNDDGKDDIASLYKDGRWYVSISTGTSFTNGSWSTMGTGWARLLVGDFNGDHRDDVAGLKSGTGNWFVSLSSGTSFGASTLWTTASSSWITQLVGDFNHDGRDDIAALFSSDLRWHVSVSTGAAFTTTAWGPTVGVTGWTNHEVADFNGDGVDDIAGFRSGDATWRVSVSNGSSAFATTTWSNLSDGGWSRATAGNFNGDAYADVANFRSSTGTWHVGLGAPPASPLRLAVAARAPAVDAVTLTQAQLNTTVAHAFSIFANLGVDTKSLGGLSFVIDDLAGNTLGLAGLHAITIDVNAAGHGWSLGDALDDDDVDLLSVVLHELGHELGLEHDDADFMAELLGLGERRLPTKAELDAALADVN